MNQCCNIGTNLSPQEHVYHMNPSQTQPLFADRPGKFLQTQNQTEHCTLRDNRHFQPKQKKYYIVALRFGGSYYLFWLVMCTKIRIAAAYHYYHFN